MVATHWYINLKSFRFFEVLDTEFALTRRNSLLICLIGSNNKTQFRTKGSLSMEENKQAEALLNKLT